MKTRIVVRLGIALGLVAYTNAAWGKAQDLCRPTEKWVRAVVMKAYAAHHDGDGDINLYLRPVGPSDGNLKAFQHVSTENLLDESWSSKCARHEWRNFRHFVNHTIVERMNPNKWSPECVSRLPTVGGKTVFCKPTADWGKHENFPGLSQACKILLSTRECLWDINDSGKKKNWDISSYMLVGEVFVGAGNNEWSNTLREASNFLGLPCKNKKDCCCQENRGGIPTTCASNSDKSAEKLKAGNQGRLPANMEHLGADSICGKEVLIKGVWARDASHVGRPEIHPISQIVIAEEPPGPARIDGAFRRDIERGLYRAGSFIDGSEDDWRGGFAELAGLCDGNTAGCVMACLGIAAVGAALAGPASMAIAGALGGIACGRIADVVRFFADFPRDEDDKWLDFTTNYGHVYAARTRKIDPSMPFRMAEIVPPLGRENPERVGNSTFVWGGTFTRGESLLYPGSGSNAPQVQEGQDLQSGTAAGGRPTILTLNHRRIKAPGSAALVEFEAGWQRQEFSVNILSVRNKTPRGVISVNAPTGRAESEDCVVASIGPGAKRWFKFEISGTTRIPENSYNSNAGWVWKIDGQTMNESPATWDDSRNRPTNNPSRADKSFRYSFWVPVPVEGRGLADTGAGYRRLLSIEMEHRGHGLIASTRRTLQIPVPGVEIEVAPNVLRWVEDSEPGKVDAFPGRVSGGKKAATKTGSKFNPNPPTKRPKVPVYRVFLNGMTRNFCGTRANPTVNLSSNWFTDNANDFATGVPVKRVEVRARQSKTVELRVFDRWLIQGDADAVVLEPPGFAVPVASRCASPQFTSPSGARLELMGGAIDTGTGQPFRLFRHPSCPEIEFEAHASETPGRGANFPLVTPGGVRYSWALDSVSWAGAGPTNAVREWRRVPRNYVQLVGQNKIRVRTGFIPQGIEHFVVVATVSAIDEYLRQAETISIFDNSPPMSAEESARAAQEMFNWATGGPPPQRDEVVARVTDDINKASRNNNPAGEWYRKVIVGNFERFARDQFEVAKCKRAFGLRYQGPAKGREAALEAECGERKYQPSWTMPSLQSYRSDLVSSPETVTKSYKETILEAIKNARDGLIRNPPRLTPSKLPPSR